ncbi:hypothetical protein DFJ74DRAFT_714139 [Hyaloraphidium curvatum]|nr:hypothetical protein DFJ74DRAFT_714139 [Hyaloraphidium curvatum]
MEANGPLAVLETVQDGDAQPTGTQDTAPPESAPASTEPAVDGAPDGAPIQSKIPVGPAPKDYAANGAAPVAEKRPTGPPAWAAKEYPHIPLAIVIMIVGSRGDVQPFVALGRMLKQRYGHRVRLATHATFRSFVTDAGLEFYPLAADPAELMAYMVKNPGVFPSRESVRSGDIGKKRNAIEAILDSCWDACIKPDPGVPGGRPFLAQLIISNPVTFAHVHCAQRLRVPLHIFFTMPWTPTRSFPHPLVRSSGIVSDDASLTNYLSYGFVENLTWTGLQDLINGFRKNTLGLQPISQLRGPYLMGSHAIPTTYTWSPDLVPKPPDWVTGPRKGTAEPPAWRAVGEPAMRRTPEDGEMIDVCGFLYLDTLAKGYEPPAELADFLVRRTDQKIVYIGFGSVVVPDPDAFTKVILEGVKLAGVRALVSQGWGGLGMKDQPAEEMDGEKQVLFIGNTPHDWLFLQIDAVVHHGGAGTTAAGLKADRPTFVVPFFGDQPFWGSMVHRMGLGAAPVHFKELTAEKLADAIRTCLDPAVAEKAKEIGARMREETGVLNACRSIHRHLPLDGLRCQLLPERLATHRLRFGPKLAMCAAAADVLIKRGLVPKWQLRRRNGGLVKWDMDDVPIELVTAILRIGKDVTLDFVEGATGLFYEPVKGGRAATAEKRPLEAFKGIGKGIFVLAYCPVKAAGRILGYSADGLRNAASTFEGKPPQARKPVTSLATGAKAGCEAVYKGFVDGLGGFLTKPVTVPRRFGVVGVPLGMAAGISSLMKPFGGMMDFCYQIIKGAKHDILLLLTPEQEARRREAAKVVKHVGIVGGPVPDDAGDAPAAAEPLLTAEEEELVVKRFQEFRKSGGEPWFGSEIRAQMAENDMQASDSKLRLQNNFQATVMGRKARAAQGAFKPIA